MSKQANELKAAEQRVAEMKQERDEALELVERERQNVDDHKRNGPGTGQS
jgi:hypothetical protein